MDRRSPALKLTELARSLQVVAEVATVHFSAVSTPFFRIVIVSDLVPVGAVVTLTTSWPAVPAGNGMLADDSVAVVVMSQGIRKSLLVGLE
jgi:hypothetical protein